MKFKVAITRTVEETRTAVVNADSENEAKEVAINEFGDSLFWEYSRISGVNSEVIETVRGDPSKLDTSSRWDNCSAARRRELLLNGLIAHGYALLDLCYSGHSLSFSQEETRVWMIDGAGQDDEDDDFEYKEIKIGRREETIPQFIWEYVHSYLLSRGSIPEHYDIGEMNYQPENAVMRVRIRPPENMITIRMENVQLPATKTETIDA